MDTGPDSSRANRDITAVITNYNYGRFLAEAVDSVLSQASLKMGVLPQLTAVPLRAFLHDIEADAGVDALAGGIQIFVSAPEDLVIEADPRLLRSAVYHAACFVTSRARHPGTARTELR